VLDVALLDVHVVDKRRLRHPEVTVLKEQGRETLRCTRGDQGIGERLLDNLAIREVVDLADEVQVLVCSIQDSCKQENKLAR
jgi:hypothetical protein